MIYNSNSDLCYIILYICIVLAHKLPVKLAKSFSKNIVQTLQKLCSPSSNFPVYKPHSCFDFQWYHGKFCWLLMRHSCKIKNDNFQETYVADSSDVKILLVNIYVTHSMLKDKQLIGFLGMWKWNETRRPVWKIQAIWTKWTQNHIYFMHFWGISCQNVLKSNEH